jgi:hypothetical protein
MYFHGHCEGEASSVANFSDYVIVFRPDDGRIKTTETCCRKVNKRSYSVQVLCLGNRSVYKSFLTSNNCPVRQETFCKFLGL